jgi:hypothetical protein
VSVRQTPTPPTSAAARRRVRLSGKESLRDVALRVFKDERLVPLLADVNPGVAATGAAAAGTIVVVPTQEEAQRFAAKMGFSLGFDPAKGGATKAKRNWSKMQNGAARDAGPLDPTQLAAALLAQEHPVAEVARRLAGLVKEPELVAFLSGPHDDERVGQVAAALEAQRLCAEVRAALVGLCDVLEGTCRPKGRRRLLEAAVSDAKTTDEVLEAFLVVPPLRADLLRNAGRAVALLEQAEAVARLDPHLQDAKLHGAGDDREVLVSLADAARQGVDVVDGERLKGLGVAPQLHALERHLGQFAGMLRKLLEHVDRAPLDILRALSSNGPGATLPKPWPVVAAVHAKVAERMARVHAGRRADGLAALVSTGEVPDVPRQGLEVPRPSSVSGPVMSAAELAAHAAHNARVADEHDDVPERLAPTFLTLFDPLRPSPPDMGPEAQVRQRRKARFEKAALSPKGSAGRAGVITALAEELLDLAKSARDETLARRARRLPAPVRAGCLALAASATGSIPALLRDASDVARALLVVSLALDPEIGPSLATAAGREAGLQLIRRHATRVVTLATQAYTTAK